MAALRNEVDLSDLLGSVDMETWLSSQGIDYRVGRGRSGRQLNVRVCPVCGNSEHKVYLNADNGAGNCFAGGHPPGENFSKWRFIRAVLGDASGRQVVEHIQAHVGQRPWMAKKVEAQAAPEKAPDLVLPTSVELPHGGRNLKYLTDRGITPEVTAYFKLRYCQKGWFPYKLDGQDRYMNFAGRVIIPVHDLAGTMVNFQGRDITGTAERKYMFPPGLASTGVHLFNGHNVRNTRRVAIGEGAFDVAALKLALDADPQLKDVVPVGTFGKHLSWGSGESQEGKFIELKERGVTEVTFLWDGELQATTDAVEAGMRLRKLGLAVRVAMLPKDKDPNEVPASVVRECFAKAVLLNQLSAVSVLMKRREMNAR